MIPQNHESVNIHEFSRLFHGVFTGLGFFNTFQFISILVGDSYVVFTTSGFQ